MEKRKKNLRLGKDQNKKGNQGKTSKLKKS
jgi:hypothetical protein